MDRPGTPRDVTGDVRGHTCARGGCPARRPRTAPGQPPHSSPRERKGARESGKRDEERRAAASADGLANSCQTSDKSPTATLSFAIGQL